MARRRKGLTVEQHRQVEALLQEANKTLGQVYNIICQGYPKKHRITNQAWNFLCVGKGIGKLRMLLSNAAWDEHREDIYFKKSHGSLFSKKACYYCGKEPWDNLGGTIEADGKFWCATEHRELGFCYNMNQEDDACDDSF